MFCTDFWNKKNFTFFIMQKLESKCESERKVLNYTAGEELSDSVFSKY
jgi:hypothetical protein